MIKSAIRSAVAFVVANLFLLGFAQAQSGDTCIVLKPNGAVGKDTYVNSYLTNPCGGCSGLVAAAWTYSGTSGIGRSLIEFDLSLIPSNATITAASLSLWWDPTPGGHVGHSSQSGSNAGYIRRVTSYWDEATTVWTNQPTFTNVNEATIPQSTGTTDDYPNIPVTGLIQDIWNNPTTSYGMVIMLQTEVQFRSLKFASSDNADSTLFPELEVCYSIPLASADPGRPTQSWMEVYPNPASDEVIVQGSLGDLEEEQLQLWNMSGQMVHQESLMTDQGSWETALDLVTLPSGIYMVKVGEMRKMLVKN